LRPKGPRNWRLRLGAAFSALLATCGVLLAMAGAASLLGRPPALGELNASPLGSAVILAIGLLLLYFGVWLWRRCRRRMRQPQALNMAPHLMKKHD
jgi:uncharacterized membrane protein YidH (DUF202 family)